MAYCQVRDPDNVFTMTEIFRMFGVSSSGYYAYVRRIEETDRKATAREQENWKIKDSMIEIIRKLYFVPGTRTFRTFLWRDYNLIVNRKRIKRLMNEMNLIPNRPKKDAYKGQATHFHECDAKQNLVDRDFGSQPRKVILTDITYLMYGKNRSTCYLCAFRDGYTKEILGWKTSGRMTVDLVKDAYEQMMEKHGTEVKNENVLLHSDQGSQYLSSTFQKILADDGLIQSTSRRGNSQDNAPMESFFGRMKCEIMDIIALCPDLKTVKNMIDGYMNVYNNVRYQHELAGLTPSEFYRYRKSGIYPLDNYYGTKAHDLITIEQIVEKRLKAAAQKSEQARKRKAEEERKLDAGRIITRDQKKINSEIRKWTRQKNLADQQLKKLNDLKEKILQASKAYFTAEDNSALRKALSDPMIWKDLPPFDYVKDIEAIY